MPLVLPSIRPARQYARLLESLRSGVAGGRGAVLLVAGLALLAPLAPVRAFADEGAPARSAESGAPVSAGSGGDGHAAGLTSANPRANQPGRVVLVNRTWASVMVEVRVGEGSACDEHPVLATRTLQQGAATSITSDDTVCYRRESSPGSGSGEWTAWTAVQVTPGAATEREL